MVGSSAVPSSIGSDGYAGDRLQPVSTFDTEITKYRADVSDGESSKFLCVALRNDAGACERMHRGAALCQELATTILPDILVSDYTALGDYIGYETKKNLRHEWLLLSQFIAQNQCLDVRTSLIVLQDLALRLSKLHNNSILHCDINVDSVMVNSRSLKTNFFCLAYATSAPVLRVSPEAPGQTSILQFAAPEMSGRMPYHVDKRSDLYSLGIVAYQMFTGRLPFEGTSVAEIVHSHIARAPERLDSVRLGIPTPVSQIVLKLLEKSPEKRYHRAESLLCDLVKVTEALETSTLSQTRIGLIDDISRPKVRDVFLGRTQALKKLVRKVDSIFQDSQSRALVIQGESGVGKSLLAEKLIDALSKRSFMKACYKFNLTSSASPFGGLSNLLSDLVSQYMYVSPTELKNVGMMMAEKLGENAPFLVELVPQLAILLGAGYEKIARSSQSYHIAPAALESRICSAFLGCLSLFACVEKPLLLYLDDIHRAGAVVIRVLHDLLTSSKDIILIATHRTHELPSLLQNDCINQWSWDQKLTLANLDESDVFEFVSSNLDRHDKEVHKLAVLITSRTGGNVFLVRQYLQYLMDNDLIRFSFTHAAWQFELRSITDRVFSLDSSEFVMQRTELLDPILRRLLEFCACLARPSIRASHLILLSKLTELQLMQEMTRLSSLGYVSIIDQSISDTDISQIHYLFGHDRIQQACLELIPATVREEKRSEIGRELLDLLNVAECSTEVVFEICDLLMPNLLTADSATCHGPPMFQLFLKAAKCSNQSLVRLEYLKCAQKISRSIEGITQNADRLLLETYIASGQHKEALKLIVELQMSTDDIANQVELLTHQAQIYWNNGEHVKVREAGQQGLQLAGFDVDFSDPPEDLLPYIMKYMSMIPQTAAEVESFKDHELLLDRTLLASQALLVTILPSIFFVSMQLLAVVLAIGVSTVFRYGVSTHGCYLLAFFGLATSDVTSPGFDYAKAKALADLALTLSEKLSRAHGSKQDADVLATMYVLQGGVNAWTVERSRLAQIYADAMIYTKRAYNLEYIAYSTTNAYGFFGFMRGHPLRHLEHLIEKSDFKRLILTGDRATQLFALPTLQTIEMLISSESMDGFDRIQGAYIEDEVLIEQEIYDLKAAMHCASYRRGKVLLAVLSGDKDKAQDQLSELRNVLPGIRGTPDWAFASIMSLFAMTDLPEDQRDSEYMRQTRKYLQIWARDCNEEFAAIDIFFQAEDLSLSGDAMGSIRLYEESIERLIVPGNLLFAGLFSERAWFRTLNVLGPTMATGFLMRSIRSFTLWGCQAKAKQLQDFHDRAEAAFTKSTYNALPAGKTVSRSPAVPNVRPELRRGRMSTTRMLSDISSISKQGQSQSPCVEESSCMKLPDVSQIDFATFIEITAMLNRVMDSDEIIKALLQHLIRVAGAGFGAMILKSDDELLVSAISDHQQVRILDKQPLVENVSGIELPVKLIRMAINSGDIISDTMIPGYEQHPRGSFIMLPLVHQSVILGLLYLENNLVDNLFTDERGKSLISVFVSQVASQLSRNYIIDALRDNEVALRKAKEAAELALTLKSRFLATMSHEIRTPFNSILGFASLLLDTDCNEEQAQMAHSIQTSSQNLLAIINDILDFSQIEQGALQLRPSDFVLDELVCASIECVMPAVIAKGLDVIHIRLGNPQTTSLYGDEGRIRQCLLNLLGNAVKFSSNDIIEISTRVFTLPGPHRAVLLEMCVKDNGIGIAEADQKHIFEHFSQVDNTSTRAVEGTGLGLAITKRLTELCKGTLTVESRQGQGSTFTATFELGLSDIPIEPVKLKHTGAMNKIVLILDKHLKRAEVMQSHVQEMGLKAQILLSIESLAKADLALTAIIVISDSSNYRDYLPKIREYIGKEFRPVCVTLPFLSINNKEKLELSALKVDGLIAVPVRRENVQKKLHDCLGFSGLERPQSFSEDGPVDHYSEVPLPVSKPCEQSPTIDTSGDEPQFTVMTVDDNRVNIMVAKKFLQRESILTETAFDGIDAIEKVKEKHFDLIFLDIHMPRMDGVEAAQKIRELYGRGYQDRTVQPYLVALTANAILGDRERYLSSGFDDYCAKPLIRDDLIAALGRATTSIHHRQKADTASRGASG